MTTEQEAPGSGGETLKPSAEYPADIRRQYGEAIVYACPVGGLTVSDRPTTGKKVEVMSDTNHYHRCDGGGIYLPPPFPGCISPFYFPLPPPHIPKLTRK